MNCIKVQHGGANKIWNFAVMVNTGPRNGGVCHAQATVQQISRHGHEVAQYTPRRVSQYIHFEPCSKKKMS